MKIIVITGHLVWKVLFNTRLSNLFSDSASNKNRFIFRDNFIIRFLSIFLFIYDRPLSIRKIN